jgi:AcrR family transcriptional regulator
MPRITREREEATRQAILSAARNVFVEKGFHAASIDDVVAASGSSVGAIYGYFKSKDELIRACVLAANKAESDAVLASARSGGTLRDRLDRAIDGWWEYTIEAPGVPAFLAEVWAAASRQPLIRDMVARRRERVVTVASILLQEAVANGDIPADTDLDDVARSIAALLDGLVIESIETGGALRQVDARRRARRVVGLDR